MPRRIIDLEEPDSFVAGAFGEPDDRTFYLQAAKGTRVVSVVLGQEQLAMLGDRMLVVVDELERRGLSAIDGVVTSDVDIETSREMPQSEFPVGTLTIAWDEDIERLIIEARAYMHDEGAGETASPDIEDAEDEIPDDAPIGPDVLRVWLKPLVAQRFARQTVGGVAAGSRQPQCPLCGHPLDPSGHLCSRRDGTDHVR